MNITTPVENVNPDRVFVAGDLHGRVRALRAVLTAAIENDCSVVLQLGDFGYFPHYEPGVEFLTVTEQLCTELGLVVVFIDGNHENHVALRELSVDDDGFVRVSPRVWWAPRGHRWEWHHVKFVALGGAYSIDKHHRTPGVSWWPQETITDEDLRRVVDGGPADIIVAHDCPAGVDIPMAFPDRKWVESDINRQYVLDAALAIRPDLIVHGHYHVRNTGYIYRDGWECRVEGFPHETGLECGVLDLKSRSESKGFTDE